LHLFSNGDADAGPEPALPDMSEVSANVAWPQSAALMAAIAVALARLSHAAIQYAPWSSGTGSDRSRWDNPRSWSPDSFATAVRLTDRQHELAVACQLLATNVADLIGLQRR
jgi:hypothetical protein